ncbi:MAG: hypothetical protein ACLQVA_03710 [Candidatus Brocadiia bacterium]
MADEVRKRRFRWARWVIWGLVILAIGITIAWHVYLSPARLRVMAESKLSEMVEGRISVAEAQFALERGIVVKGIRIEDPGAGTAQPVAEIEEVTLLPRWGALLSGSFVAREIQIEHPQVNLELDEAGRWPFLSRLHLPKATGWPMPRVDVVRGEIQISSSGPQKRIPDMQFAGIEGNLRTWSVNEGAWWSEISVPDGVLGKIRAQIHNSGLNDQVQANVRLSGVELGPEIRDLLPPAALPTWDSYAPGGTMDVEANLTWDPAKEPPLDIEGEAQLHDASVKLPMLHVSGPTELTDIRGRVTFNPKEINAQGVTGRYGEAPFVITSGLISLEEDGPFELAGSAYGCKVEGLFKEMMPKEGLDQIPAWLKEYLLEAKISGQVDGSLELSRAKGEKEVQSSVEVSARDLTLSHSRLGYPLILNVSFRYGGNALWFSQASARWGGASIEMPPTTFDFTEGAARDFSVHVSNLLLEPKLHDLLPASITQQLDESAVGGIVDVDFHAERAEGAAETHTRTLLYLRDGRMAYVDFPYPVEHLFGRAEIIDDELKGAEFSGMNGPTQIGVTIEKGKYKGMPGRLTIVRAMGGVLNEDVRKGMPSSFLKLWDTLKPQGTINLNLAIQFYDDPKLGPEQSIFTCDATLPKFSLQAAIPLQLTVANLTVEQAMEAEPGKLFIRGRFNVAQASLEGVQTEGLRGTFSSRGGVLRLEDVAADCFGGRLAGSLAIRGDADEAYVTADEFRGELFLTDANVRDIIQGTDIKGMSGRLSAASGFSGSLSNPQNFRATGAMTIREGQIGALPGILSVLNLLQFKRLGAAAFHDMELSYRIKGSTLIADELNLIGTLISLYGSGTMEKDGKQMDFKFRVEVGPKLPRIPLVAQLFDFLDWIKGNVIPIKVSGDYSDPVWRLNPALSLTRSIQSAIAQLVPLDFLKPKKPGSGTAPAK